MRRIDRIVFAILLFFIVTPMHSVCLSNADIVSQEDQTQSRLAVLWTSADPEVAFNVCFMYTHNAKKRGWFDEVLLIIWGPSARLTAENEMIQQAIRKMDADGVNLQACRACADNYGVSAKLEALGIEVKYMGVPLTEMLQSDWKVLTF